MAAKSISVGIGGGGGGGGGSADWTPSYDKNMPEQLLTGLAACDLDAFGFVVGTFIEKGVAASANAAYGTQRNATQLY